MPRNARALSRRVAKESALDKFTNPSGTGIPAPPEYLSAAAREIWQQIVPQAVSGGFLRAQDSTLLGELCQVLSVLPKVEQEKQLGLRKLVLEYSDRLGLSPKARAAIDLPEQEEQTWVGLHSESLE